MPIDFLTFLLPIVTIGTNLTVEMTKKILDELKIKYYSNILAGICSIMVSVITCFVYIVYNDMIFDMKCVVEVVTTTYLGFLAATLGYDKILQSINQMKTKNTNINKLE